MQNGFCESFNGRMRDELLNESLFLGLDHARHVIGAWVKDYNTVTEHPRLTPRRSPQRALGYATPTSSAERLLVTPRRKTYQPPRL